ncbi:MAG: type II toxin-antitoxin system VapC family toxin [Desulfobacterales bacterium]|nr:type II toxin-antitoxin system VapC family toxin [Desulfobacterales bacterium]
MGGKRKTLLLNLAKRMFQEDFTEWCLPFDCHAAGEYTLIVARRMPQGRPISVEGAPIAAIAKTAGLELATRNAKDFSENEGLKVVNPWMAPVG